MPKTTPPKPNTKCGPGLSNEAVIKRNVPTKSGTAHNKNLWFLLTNGNARMNIPIGIIKNWFPPQDDNPKLMVIAPKIIFRIAVFLFSDFIALKNKYNPSNP